MMRQSLRPRFVEFIPEALEDGVLYVSMEYMTVAHKCCCGCGTEVSIPLSPTDWRLTYDGKGVSLEPSIGNWSLPCRSHYFITYNRVRWAEQWTPERIQAGKAHVAAAKLDYFQASQAAAAPPPLVVAPEPKPVKVSFWQRVKAIFGRD